nr:hypothetical protein CFP56_40436 [Quercus suber]
MNSPLQLRPTLCLNITLNICVTSPHTQWSKKRATQLHGKQPQPQPQASSSVTVLPRPSPMGNKSIQQNTKWIHKPKEKEISNTPVMEVCTDIHPTLYSIKPEVMTLDINAVSKTGMTNQHVIRFRPKCPTSSETVSQSNLEKLLYVGAEPDNIILIQK